MKPLASDACPPYKEVLQWKAVGHKTAVRKKALLAGGAFSLGYAITLTLRVQIIAGAT